MGWCCAASRIDDPDELWVHELIGCTVAQRRRRGPGRGRVGAGQPGGRPAGARLRARWCRWCSSSDTPTDGVDPRRHARRPVRAGGVRHRRAHRRPDDLPRDGRRPSPSRACWVGPGAPWLLDLRVHDLRDATTDVHRTRRRLPVRRWRRHGADGRARSSTRSSASSRPGRCSCWVPAVDAWTRPWRSSWPPAGGSRCCAAATRASTSGCAQHLVDGELSIGDYVLAGGEVAAMVVLEAVGRLVPGVMGNDESAGEESFSVGPARVPAVHPARGVPGVGGARGAALGRSRPGGPLAARPGAWPAPLARPPGPDRGRGWALRRRPRTARRVRALARRRTARPLSRAAQPVFRPAGEPLSSPSRYARRPRAPQDRAPPEETIT